MALRKFVERLTKPVEEIDQEKLEAWCEEQGTVPLDRVSLRRPVTVAGEVNSVRIVPRAGADALEATVQDGHGQVVAVFMGRRRISGITPGRRMILEGVITTEGRALLMYNPVYTLR